VPCPSSMGRRTRRGGARSTDAADGEEGDGEGGGKKDEAREDLAWEDLARRRKKVKACAGGGMRIGSRG
jgi:hypothetical protein